jgi:intracellular septation protein A
VEELGASDLIAMCAVAFFAFNTRTILLASSAMSEAVFTVLSVSAVWAAAAHIRTPSVRTALISAVLVGAAILTRSSGIVLLMAIGIIALVRHKLSAALPVLVAGALVFAAWALWAQTHVLNPGNPSLTFYTSYSGQFRDRYQLLGPGGFALLLAENAFMLIPVSVPLVFFGLGYSAIPGLRPELIVPALVLLFAVFAIIAAGFFRHLRRGLDLVHVYAACYLLFHVIWPYSSYDRFVMPLLPFIAFFFVYEMADLIARFKSWIVVLGAITLFWSYVNATEIWKDAVQSRKNFAARSDQDEQLAAWIRRNTRPSDVFLCYPDPLYYLRTDRKAIAAEVSLVDPSTDPQSLLRQLTGFGSQYIIENDRKQLAEFRPDIGINGVPALLRSHSDSFVPVFSAGDATIYRVVANY